MPHWIASAFGLPGALGCKEFGVAGRWPLHSYGCMRLRNSFVSRTSIYLDHNATAPLHPAARDAMCAAFDLCGNASSVHAEGRAARATIDSARAEVAAFAGAAPKNVVFTSGGTEALNLVLTPHIEISGEKSRPFDLLLAGAGEHSAVLAGHRFAPAQLELVGLTSLGVLDLEALNEAVARASATGHRIMLAIQAANNETGVMQPVAAAAEIIHAAGGVLICDAVQAAGKIPCELGSLGADAIVFSAHKFGGPKGAGALCFGSGSYHIEDVLLRGGGQERGLRAGTENIAAIAGMAAGLAAAKARLGEANHGAVSLAGRNGGRDRACLARRSVLRRWRAKVAEYVLLRPAPPSKRKCCLWLWIWRVSRYRRVRLVRRGRCNGRMC